MYVCVEGCGRMYAWMVAIRTCMHVIGNQSRTIYSQTHVLIYSYTYMLKYSHFSGWHVSSQYIYRWKLHLEYQLHSFGTYLLTYLLTHIFTHSLTYSLTRSHIPHSLTYSLTHVHIHSLTYLQNEKTKMGNDVCLLTWFVDVYIHSYIHFYTHIILLCTL